MTDDGAARLRDAQRRRGLAFVASAAAHAIILFALVLLLPEIERPHHDWVLAYLVEFDRPARGASARDARAGSLPAPAHEASALKSPTVISRPKPPHTRQQTAAITARPVPGPDVIAARKESEVPAKAGTSDSRIEVTAVQPPSLNARAGAGRGDAATGNGAGSSSAHVEYGQNPVPIYPIEARRKAEQGTVLLDVEVDADGSVTRVVIAQSSGFDSLDQSAIETVRTRWRFVPARRDGNAVESWCEVPIRFALTEANAR